MNGAIRVILGIAVVALIVWLLVYFLPMPYPFGTIIVGVGVIACILLALRELWPGVGP